MIPPLLHRGPFGIAGGPDVAHRPRHIDRHGHLHGCPHSCLRSGGGHGCRDSRGAADPVEIALGYLEANPGALGVTAADVDDLAVASSYRSSHNGVTHVNVNQRFDGLEVFGAYATVNVADEGEVLFVGDSLVSGLKAAGPAEPDLDALEAVGAAADELDLDEPRNVRVIRSSRGVAQETVLSGGQCLGRGDTGAVGLAADRRRAPAGLAAGH